MNVCRFSLALLRVNNVVVLGNLALNLLGAVWVFSIGVPRVNACPLALHATVFAHSLLWAVATIVLPILLKMM